MTHSRYKNTTYVSSEYETACEKITYIYICRRFSQRRFFLCLLLLFSETIAIFMMVNHLHMNKLLSFCLSVLAVCACGNKVCTISGTIDDPVDSVSLVDLSGAELDKCAVVDGAFTLTCPRGPEMGVSIVRGELYMPIALVADSKAITISMADGQPVISGSPLSEALQELQQWTMATFSDYMQRANALMEEGDQEKAAAVNEERDQVLATRHREVYLDHKDDLLGVQAMSLLMFEVDEDEFIDLYEQGGKVIQDDAEIGGYYEQVKALYQNGGNVITLQEDGKLVEETGAFEDFVGAGKYTLVDFWASWCGPCKEETPNVVAVFDKYRDKGLVVIGVTVNDKKDASVEAMKELGIHYPQVLDTKQELAERFGVQGIPHIILFDPDGNIVAENLRGERIEEAVAVALSD